jgi:UDP-2-acetamido-2,6-beta-L-arabino-hexul-4-ose reductase
MKILITGENGFIGKNLAAQLAVNKEYQVMKYNRDSNADELKTQVAEADFICHLAGVNRPDDINEFKQGNTELTRLLCETIEASGRSIPVIFTSSVHVERSNAYGDSKLAAEKILIEYSERTKSPVYIFRLPHVIGKWCRPNYNSVVATFCYNIAHDLPIQLDNPSFQLNVVYIDDLVSNFIEIMKGVPEGNIYCDATPSYPVTVGELAELIRSFKSGRQTLVTERVGAGLVRALYATYISYLSPKDFVYPLVKHEDPRGVFVEMLKTRDSGQFSFFTAHPGITRGGHYHHSKSEKFLVLKGKAKFRFRHILTDEYFETFTDGDKPEVVETIPGWAHDITNIGEDEMYVMIWANEIFDKEHPDTYTFAF